jgi:hypothetical protein
MPEIFCLTYRGPPLARFCGTRLTQFRCHGDLLAAFSQRDVFPWLFTLGRPYNANSIDLIVDTSLKYELIARSIDFTHAKRSLSLT